jgi:hypothetical protein
VRALAWIAIAAWAAFLFYGQKQAAQLATSCTAHDAMPANHRITRNDVNCAESGAAMLYAGTYIRDQVAKDGALVPALVSDVPMLRLLPSEGVFEMNADGLPAGVDAGSNVDLASKTWTRAKRVRLVALRCLSRGGDDCLAVFAVPRGDLTAMWAEDPAQIQIAIADPKKGAATGDAVAPKTVKPDVTKTRDAKTIGTPPQNGGGRQTIRPQKQEPSTPKDRS